MSSSPPNSSDDRRRHLGRRFEDQRRRDELDRDQALREQRERTMEPVRERIRDATSRLFPQTAAAHGGASGAPEPPEQRATPPSPQDPRPGEEGDSGKIVVQAEEHLDGETSGSDGGDGDADGAAIADVRMQLAEQERVCETLREDIGQKDREIKALKDERDAAELAKATAGLDGIAEWRDKHERTVEVLSKVQKERRELEERLEESESRERVLKKQLEEAKEAKRDVEEKLRHEENRTARSTTDAVAIHQDRTWIMQH
ncbi:hypothetical protein NpNSSI1_00001132 [Neofusicoccum parvum]|nr:hypothetical protein NpNSSI1_00001132 [Neofusicoccum parvum]